MKRGLIPFIIILATTVFSLQSLAQFTPEELAERACWEEFLRTAKIVNSESIGEGVTKPKKIFLKKGDVEGKGVWKSPAGSGAGVFDKWESEIAAYRLDKLLGLNLIPPTVERRFRGRSGSLQLWVSLETNELKRVEQNIPFPEDKKDHLECMKYIQRAFDSLIANTDRSQQNIGYTKDWRMILIDHSRSFTGLFPEQLIYGKYGLKSQLRFPKLPRTLIQNLKALNIESIRATVEHYASYQDIKSMLYRRNIILKEIDELIREMGEYQVLY